MVQERKRVSAVQGTKPVPADRERKQKSAVIPEIKNNADWLKYEL